MILFEDSAPIFSFDIGQQNPDPAHIWKKFVQNFCKKYTIDKGDVYSQWSTHNL